MRAMNIFLDAILSDGTNAIASRFHRDKLLLINKYSKGSK